MADGRVGQFEKVNYKAGPHRTGYATQGRGKDDR